MFLYLYYLYNRNRCGTYPSINSVRYNVNASTILHRLTEKLFTCGVITYLIYGFVIVIFITYLCYPFNVVTITL